MKVLWLRKENQLKARPLTIKDKVSFWHLHLTSQYVNQTINSN